MPLFTILTSAIWTLVGFIFDKALIKFVVFFALFFIIQEFASVIADYIPNLDTFNSSFANISSASWYFMDLFAFSHGASLVLTAHVYRFIIRRIPLIG